METAADTVTDTSRSNDNSPPHVENACIAPPVQPPPEADVCSDTRKWHGCIPPSELPLPKCVAKTALEARPGYESINASEYIDTSSALLAKLQIVAEMLKKSKATVVYSGAGLSTASGIGDYASRAATSVAPHKSRGESGNRLSLEPTIGHHVCAALERNDLLHHWLQQNHDRLAQKAGFPQEKLNEIHGAWGDMKNPVISFNDGLRPDLHDWMLEWIKQVNEVGGVCLALGTSLCGMSADAIAEVAGQRGLVIIGLSPTSMDHLAAVRIWGVLDNVLVKLATVLNLKKIPNPVCRQAGMEW
eukprot:CAMPEP_0181323990 /NCGR_PEP_ID=MMETSP1101-20121128/20100_1 /TAXON_ID=46948 /ORGANISM="Rhodomonas abbreviata, Strain Caron Lab Isolate" /LENGTH=301 /DNA_ID=CAMNT_0023432095 /DNA_START=109 /DNA_END=1011 /DNA_ORIENTATION=-